MENIKRLKKRNFGLLGIGTILFAILIAPALADPGQFTGCLSVTKGTLYNIQAGSTPMSTCSRGDVVISFYDNKTVDALQANVTTLQGQVASLQANVSTLQGQVASDEANITALQTLLSGVTRNGNDINITGANLHILSGSGSTDGPINGLGNLIIGYNELRGSGDIRTGSHNLILGKGNNYENYGGLVAGFQNNILGPFASISGGNANTASGFTSSISGGIGNTASGTESSVSGGGNNKASGDASSISGGQVNTASGASSSVSGGQANIASGGGSSVSGGFNNYNAAGLFNWAAGTTGTSYTGNFFANS